MEEFEVMVSTIKRENKKWFLFLMVSLIFAYLTKGITLVFVLVSLFMVYLNNKKLMLIRKEYHEQDKILDVLKGLPSGYSVLNQVLIYDDNESKRIERVLIGPTGIFVIKTLAVKGEVVGTFEDEVWLVRDKESYISNPIKEVEVQVRQLATYLKGKGVQSWVQGLVYFSSEDTELNVQDNQTPVFLNNEDENRILRLYIESYVKEIISDGRKRQITELLSNVK